jgi:hypothetical protein
MVMVIIITTIGCFNDLVREGYQFEVLCGVIAFVVACLVGFGFGFANILAFFLSKRKSALSVIWIVSFH